MLEDIKKAINAITGALHSFLTLFTPAGLVRVVGAIENYVRAVIQQSGALATELSPALAPLAQQIAALMKTAGSDIEGAIDPLLATFAQTALAAATNSLEGKTNIQPADWLAIAGAAYSDAVQFGLGSFAVTAAFEALFPEKLNTLNGFGPMLATLAGFEEITRASLGPVLFNGIAQPARYDAASKFRSMKPAILNAEILLARRIITVDQFNQILAWAGLDPTYVAAYQTASYRPIQPRALVNIIQDTPFPTAQVEQILQDNGYTDDHVALLLQLFQYNSTKNVRNSYIAEAVQAYQNGVMSDAELNQILTDQGYSTDAIGFVTQRALLARRIKLAAEVERSVVPLVAQGNITPDQGEAQLEAAGVQPWYAQLQITLATTKAAVHQAKVELTAEQRKAAAEQRAATQAAIKNFESGTLNETTLAASLASLGVDPVVIAAIVSRLDAIKAGRLRLLYGNWLDPSDAKALADRVGAIEAQVHNQLLTPDQAGQQLADLGVDDVERNALLAKWAASKGTSTTQGVLLSPFTGKPPS